MSRYLNEPERCRQAFDYFYKLGGSRSWYKVAQKFGVASPTVKSWAIKYEWADRVKEMDMNNGRDVLNNSDAALIVEMDKNRSIIKKGLADFLKRLEKGEVQVDKVRDAVNLMKLDMDLAQFITDLKHRHEEEDVNIKISIDTKQTIDTLMAQLNSLPEVDDQCDDGVDSYDDLVNYDIDADKKVDGSLDDFHNNTDGSPVVSI